MAGLIPPEFIDDLLARTDIVDLVGTRIQLRKAGKDFEARCPFHDEKTPSFTVSPDKQFYHCFGCGAHGTAIGFLMEYDHLGFREAVEELAHRVGLELPGQGEAVRKGPDHAPLLRLMEQAVALYKRQLREHPQADRAVAYLKGRGLTGDMAARFDLGYAPAQFDFLSRQLGMTGADEALLLACGLMGEQDGRRYDRFRDRVIFPIRDRRGRVIGLGGRLLGDGKPKYLNSPETPIFHKGRELYGLYEAQQHGRKLSSILVVEGYMDVIALAQFGISNAVATLGTATTAEHLRQLARVAPEVVFCFDGDRAGREAAWKALQAALPLATGQQSIRFLFLPDGEDPDTLVRRVGPEPFSEQVAQAQPLSDLLIDRLAEQVEMTSLEGRARLATLAQPLVEQMPQGIYRDLVLRRIAEVTGVGERPGPPARAGRRLSRRAPLPLNLSRVAKAIALLLDNPQLAGEASAVDDAWRRLSSPGVDVLVRLLDTLAEHPDISKAALLERWRDHPHFSYLQRISVDPFLRDIEEEHLGDELSGALLRLSEEARKAERWRPFNQRSTADWSDEERARLEREAAAARKRGAEPKR